MNKRFWAGQNDFTDLIVKQNTLQNKLDIKHNKHIFPFVQQKRRVTSRQESGYASNVRVRRVQGAALRHGQRNAVRWEKTLPKSEWPASTGRALLLSWLEILMVRSRRSNDTQF